MDIHFEGEISCGPITLEYLAKNNISLGIMYRFRETVDDPELQEHFDAVLRMASDMICNTCYELKIDPAVLDYWQPGNDCIVTLYEPEVPDQCFHTRIQAGATAARIGNANADSLIVFGMV